MGGDRTRDAIKQVKLRTAMSRKVWSECNKTGLAELGFAHPLKLYINIRIFKYDYSNNSLGPEG